MWRALFMLLGKGSHFAGSRQSQVGLAWFYRRHLDADLLAGFTPYLDYLATPSRSSGVPQNAELLRN